MTSVCVLCRAAQTSSRSDWSDQGFNRLQGEKSKKNLVEAQNQACLAISLRCHGGWWLGLVSFGLLFLFS